MEKVLLPEKIKLALDICKQKAHDDVLLCNLVGSTFAINLPDEYVVLHNYVANSADNYLKLVKAIVTDYEEEPTNEQLVSDLLKSYFNVNDVAVWVLQSIRDIYNTPRKL